MCSYVRTWDDSVEYVVADLLRSCRGVAWEMEAGGVGVGVRVPPPHDPDLHGEYLPARQIDRNAHHN
jgi:hypothetical protein